MSFRVAEDLQLSAEVEDVHVQVALGLDAVVAHREHMVLVQPQLVADFYNLEFAFYMNNIKSMK